MKKLIFSLMALAMMASCNNYKADNQKLIAQNDSLRNEAAKTAADYEEMLSLMNEIEDNFKEIRSAESYLSMQSVSKGEIQTSARERIKSDLVFVTETLKKNREQLADLEKKVNNSNYQSKQLKKRIDELNTEINEKSVIITGLQKELVKRDASIQKLTSNVASLQGDVSKLQEETSTQQSTIKNQDQELNTAWYVVGNSRQLKEWKIIEGGTIFKKLNMLMNKEMFSKIDVRNVKEIPLHSKKAKLLTDHPALSYSLQADENKELTLIITDQKEFWSISKYLVVRIN